jgi:hypothetical protein
MKDRRDGLAHKKFSMRFSRASYIVGAALFWLLVALPSHAASNRVFMSPSGDDSGDCANPLTPCLTFAGAQAQVNSGGEVIVEASGEYGSLFVTKALTISSPPGVVMFCGSTITVYVPGGTVVLRGLTMDGTGVVSGNGINVVAIGSFVVEDCVIANFTGGGPTGGTGIFFGCAGRFSVSDTIVRGNASLGIWVRPATGIARATLDHCRIEGNNFGLDSYTNAITTVRDSVGSGSMEAFLAEGGELNLESCVIENNQFGLVADSGSTMRVSNTTVTDNFEGVDANGGAVILTRGNNTVEGNTINGTFSGTYSAK